MFCFPILLIFFPFPLCQILSQTVALRVYENISGTCPNLMYGLRALVIFGYFYYYSYTIIIIIYLRKRYEKNPRNCKQDTYYLGSWSNKVIEHILFALLIPGTLQ